MVEIGLQSNVQCLTLFFSSSLARSAADMLAVASRNIFKAESLSIILRSISGAIIYSIHLVLFLFSFTGSTETYSRSHLILLLIQPLLFIVYYTWISEMQLIFAYQTSFYPGYWQLHVLDPQYHKSSPQFVSGSTHQSRPGLRPAFLEKLHADKCREK